MTSHFYSSLEQWHTLTQTEQACSWVLACVIRTEGPVYRKTGALMLISDIGHQLGILSGGCLEADLKLQAQKALALGKSTRVIYDSNDEGGLAWNLGIGCGGLAEILLQPCLPENNYLELNNAYRILSEGKACAYQLHTSPLSASVEPINKDFSKKVCGEIVQTDEQEYLRTLINPAPHLLIFGAGVDMYPVADLAIRTGWVVSVVDKRPGNQKTSRMPEGANIYNCEASTLPKTLLNSIDCAIVATHNLDMDAAALLALQATQLQYLGLLGPQARKENVLAIANILEQAYPHAIAGPMGLALGGDVPESVALSVLAECHAVLFGATAKPMSQAYL